jgi:hypothetical protein
MARGTAIKAGKNFYRLTAGDIMSVHLNEVYCKTHGEHPWLYASLKLQRPEIVLPDDPRRLPDQRCSLHDPAKLD